MSERKTKKTFRRPAGKPAPRKKPVAAPRPSSEATPGKRLPRVPFEVDVTALNDEGIGLAVHNGKDVLVAGGFPGERVECLPEFEGQHRIVGDLRKVLKRSPNRIQSPCRCNKRCQGCPLIALDYTEQLRLKTEKIRRALSGQKVKTPRLKTILGAENPLGYRTTVKLVFGKARGKTLLGLYRRGTHKVVDIGDCPLHHPLVNQIAAVVKEEVDRQGVYVYNSDRQSGLLRYLLVRVSPELNKAMVTFVVAERDYKRLTPLAKWLQRKIPQVVSVQQNVNTSSGNVIVGRDTQKLLGAPDLFDTVGDVRLRIAPASFFQVNHEQAARIYGLVRDWAELTGNETVVDLYCGIGGIALHLAPYARKVIGIEVVPDAVRNAIDNAQLNGLKNCRFIAGDATEMLEDLDLPRDTLAVLNPPRKGCEEDLLTALVESPVDRVIYVSCGPDSLARDLAFLEKQGFQVQEVQPVDMFPQTLHVETVVLLERAG